MPTVGHTKFPYTPAGKKAAKKFSKITGQKMVQDPEDVNEPMDTPQEDMGEMASQHPMMPMSPTMVSSIKQSPKGQLPPGLAKWLATHKKGKKK